MKGFGSVTAAGCQSGAFQQHFTGLGIGESRSALGCAVLRDDRGSDQFGGNERGRQLVEGRQLLVAVIDDGLLAFLLGSSEGSGNAAIPFGASAHRRRNSVK